MCWRSRGAAVFFGVMLLISCQKKETEVKRTPLVEAEELLSQLLVEELVIVDFRTKEEYDKGHIPGAVRAWRSDIESPDYPYGGMMASAAQLESLFSNLGIQSEARLVLYDAKGGCDAARLWWVLSQYGFHRAQLLNGGIQAWKEIGGALSYSDKRKNPAVFRFRQPVEGNMHISKEELTVLGEDSEIVLIDARTLDEYNGKRQKKRFCTRGTNSRKCSCRLDGSGRLSRQYEIQKPGGARFALWQYHSFQSDPGRYLLPFGGPFSAHHLCTHTAFGL